MGFSGGGSPNLDLGIRLNAYADARYAVHHVTAIDAGTRIQPQSKGSWDLWDEVVELFLNSSVDGEPRYNQKLWMACMKRAAYPLSWNIL
jgi:hypothetical protein